MKKAVLGLLLLVVLAVGGASLYVNELVGTAIEKAGSYVLGVDTTVGFVRLRILPGDFRLIRLRVENPGAFDKPHFLTMRRATLDVDTATLREPVVRVPELRIDGVDVNLERRGERTNYGAILENMKRFEKRGSQGAKRPAGEGGGDKRFIVSRIEIFEVEAYVEWNELAPSETGLQLTIPEIVLKDVGAAGGRGVTMGELTDIVLKAILGSISRYGGDLPGALMGALDGGMRGLVGVPGVVVTGIGGGAIDKTGELVGGEVGGTIRGAGGSAAGGVGEVLDSSAKKALGGLFGGEEKD